MLRNQEEYLSKFQSVLDGLNPEQKDAVTQIDGPMLVIAGPGTGKTQILAARIGYILLNTDSFAENILCLTYTDAGTIAMRERLIEMIGPEAYKVNIFTYHGFCNMVIQENSHLFSKKELMPASELDQVRVIKQIIDRFDNEHPLKKFKASKYQDVSNLRDHFSTMKNENWSALYLKQKADEYIANLPNRDEFVYKRKTGNFQKGDIKQNKINDQKEKMDKLVAASEELNAYMKLMEDEGKYDYDDMIYWVLNAFKSNQNLLLNYQERFHYFLVDEFQDSNGSQIDILNLLTDYELPNIFVVGDDDQSIYRFQGAKMENILNFRAKYTQDIKKVTLIRNYRSIPSILKYAGNVIDYNEERISKIDHDIDKTLISENPKFKEDKALPKLYSYETTVHEDIGIVNHVKQLLDEGVEPKEIAIISRKHAQIDDLIKLFDHNKVRYNLKRKIDILQEPFIKGLIKVLEFVESDGKSDFLLFEIMHLNHFNIATQDILRVARYFKDKVPNKFTWRETIINSDQFLKAGVTNIEPFKIVSEAVEHLIKQKYNLTIQLLFEQLLTKGKVLEYIMHHPRRTWMMQLVNSFFDFIKNESAKWPEMTLKDLLHLIDDMRENDLRLQATEIFQTNDGVNIITAHSSKLLEYDYFFLKGCTDRKWEKSRGANFGYTFPDTVTKSNSGDSIEDERRVFFVAMTRARKELIISHATADQEGKGLEKSQFLVELEESNDAQSELQVLEEKLLMDSGFKLLMEVNLPKVELLDKHLIERSVKNLKMSVTALNKYLECPLSFYFENIVRVPAARNAYMGFGSAMHYAVELYFKSIKPNAKSFPGEKVLIDYFIKGMQRYKSHFTEKEFDSFKDAGLTYLPEYLKTRVGQWALNTRSEYNISTEVDGIPITGKLDKIEFFKDDINVVDYKTGKPKNAKKKLAGPSDKNPEGEGYWRQIVFYKLLLDNNKKNNWHMVSGEFDFFEPDEKGEYIKQKIVVSPQDMEVVKRQLREAYKGIQNHEFDQGCGKKDCTWCNFVKENYNTEELAYKEEEEQDVY